MPIISQRFHALNVGRPSPGAFIVIHGRHAMIGYVYQGFVIDFYRPTATHCIELVPTHGLAMSTNTPHATSAHELRPLAVIVTREAP